MSNIKRTYLFLHSADVTNVPLISAFRCFLEEETEEILKGSQTSAPLELNPLRQLFIVTISVLSFEGLNDTNTKCGEVRKLTQ